MNWKAMLVAVALSLFFFAIELEWLAFVVLVIGVIGLFWKEEKSGLKKTWQEVKKADATHPQAKFDAYVKGASKSAAEILQPPENTEIGAKNWLHKTHNMAKNFFSELEGLFK